jgi:hypothetical protein
MSKSSIQKVTPLTLPQIPEQGKKKRFFKVQTEAAPVKGAPYKNLPHSSAKLECIN